jgi:hypothetical protein
MKKLLIVALATGAFALTACDRNDNRTDRTGTKVDQTSGTVGLDANSSSSSSGTASTGTATTDTSTATNSGTATTTNVNPATTEAGSTTTATTDTSPSANHKKVAKKKMNKKTDSAKANSSGSGAYIPPAEKPVIRDSTINEPSEDVSSNTVSASEDESLNEPSYSSTTQAADDSSMKDATALRDALQANYYEPQSLQPDKTGTTSITGEDRSHAQFFSYKGNLDLVDPTVNVTADFDKQKIDKQ